MKPRTWSNPVQALASLRPFGLRRQQRLEAEIDEEFRFHLEMSASRLVQRGMPPDQAAQTARLQFGDALRLRKECLAVYEHHPLLVFFRSLSGVATLSLGLGAVLCIFLAFNAAFFRLPLTFHSNATWMAVWWESPETGRFDANSSLSDFLHWRASHDLPVDRMTAAVYRKMHFDDGEDPLNVRAKQVSANYFAFHGVKPLHGRDFLPEEVEFQAKPVAMLNFEFWHSRYGGRTDVIGRTISLDGIPHEIVGVLPDRFKMYFETELFTPLNFEHARSDYRYLLVAGQLQKGTSKDEAQTAFQSIQPSNTEIPAPYTRVKLRPVQDVYASPVKQPLTAAFGVVILLFLVTWVHASKNHVRRRFSKSQSPSVPSSSRRSQRVRALIITVVAGFCALAIAWIILPELSTLLFGDFAGVFDIKIDLRVGIFFAAVLTVTALFQMLPGIHRLSQRNAWRLYKSLVGLELALALAFSLAALHAIQPFFLQETTAPLQTVENVYTFSAELPPRSYNTGRKHIDHFNKAFQSIDQISSIERASLARSLPRLPHTHISFTTDEDADATQWIANCNDIGIDFFDILPAPIVAGSTFAQITHPFQRPIAIINKKLAEREWPGRNPVGEHIRPRDFKRSYEIVGVVDDSRLDATVPPTVYRLYWQNGGPEVFFTLLTRNRSAAETARTAVQAIDPDVPLGPLVSLDEYVQSTRNKPMTLAGLSLLAGLAVLLLVARGIYRFAIDAVNLHNTSPEHASFRDLLEEIVHVVALGTPAGLFAAWLLFEYVAPGSFQAISIAPTTWTVFTLLYISLIILAYFVPIRRNLRAPIYQPGAILNSA